MLAEETLSMLSTHTIDFEDYINIGLKNNNIIDIYRITKESGYIYGYNLKFDKICTLYLNVETYHHFANDNSNIIDKHNNSQKKY